MNENPLVVLLYAGAAGYLLHIWLQDYKLKQTDTPPPAPLPGATPVSTGWLWIAGIGAAILVALETAGEGLLGIHDEQTTIQWWFLIAMLAAGIIEEVVFRGYLISLKRGPFMMWASVVGFSLLFAVLHPYLWQFESPEDGSWLEGRLIFDFGVKAWFTTTFLFLNSLFFYCLRVAPGNPHRSLLPCFVAHTMSNLLVYLVKAFQGFVVI